MTPNDILGKKFEKAMGGYKQEDVNRFQIEVGDYVEDLLSERDDLLQKMEFLAEKLEEYRADEESLRSAIISAQKLGDSVVRESRQKAELLIAEARSRADEILADARYKSEIMLEETRKSIETEQYTLDRVKTEAARFKKMILTMYDQQIQLIQTIPYTDVPEPEPPAHLAPKPVKPRREKGGESAEPPVKLVVNDLDGEGEAQSTSEDEILAELRFEPVAVHEDLPHSDREEEKGRRGRDLKNWFGEDRPIARKD